MMLEIKKYNVSSQELTDCARAGFDPLPFICRCTDGDFIWDNDIMKYIPYTEYSRKHHEWKHSKHVNLLPLILNMTSDQLWDVMDSSNQPIRHTICQCLDGDFIWDEERYTYVPYVK